MTSAELARRFDARQTGEGWLAKCPAHEDQRASLSIGTGKDGRVLLRCHARCSWDAIVAAAGLTPADLFPPTSKTTKKTIVCTYDYPDVDGTLLYQSVRYSPKDFKQRRPDGNGGWIWKVGKDVTRVPYRLPQIMGQRIVLITEGEKDADKLITLNYAATTNVGGAGKWRDEYARTLYVGGTRIVGIFEDHDDAGRKHAAHVAASCARAGLIASIIPLPGLSPKGDVSDWLQTHTPAELEAIITTTLTHTTEAALGREPANVESPDLNTILSDVESFIRAYVVLSPDAAVLMTLWIAQTHAIRAFEYVAYLHIKSPMPECGKSRCLEVLEALVEHPWLTGRVTAAVLMRKVDAEHPVLLLDESDAQFNGDKEYAEALRGQLNTGFHRSGKASACVGQGANITYKDFSTFGAKAIAGIGKLDPTIESRSIPVSLKRRTRDERIAKWRRRDAWAAADPLRTQLAFVMAGAVETLKSARPAIPDGLSDRAEDVLEPILSIADAAGGDWPTRARAAALALMGTAARVAQESNQNLGLELLADIRMIFDEEGNPDSLPSKELIAGLVAFEDRPWGTIVKGEKPITPNRLRLMLRPFDVHPAGNIRRGEKVLKSYRLATFTEAFDRYLPLDPGSKPLQRNNVNKTGPEPAKNEPLQTPGVADAKSPVYPDKHSLCSAVAVCTPDPEGGGAHDDQKHEEDEADADPYYGA